MEVQEGKTKELASSSLQDQLVECIFVLKTAQEALEKEVLKLKEISEHTSVKYLVLEAQAEFTDVRAQFQETSCGQYPSTEVVQDLPRSLHSEVVEIENREVENLFMQRIEAEVEYIVLSRMIEKQRVGALDESSNLKQQKTAFSEERQMPYNCGDKTAIFRKESWKGENCEGNSSADETLEIQKRVRVHTSYFILLLLILGVFIFQFLPNYVGVVPT